MILTLVLAGPLMKIVNDLLMMILTVVTSMTYRMVLTAIDILLTYDVTYYLLLLIQ